MTLKTFLTIWIGCLITCAVVWVFPPAFGILLCSLILTIVVGTLMLL